VTFSLVPAAEVEPEALARFLQDAVPARGFRRSETPVYYQWLIGSRACGETVALVALDGQRIAGALCAVLRRLHVGGETLLAAKLEEMKTDLQDRGRGIMSLVFQGVAKLCAERGAHVLLAGPTSPFSYPIFLNRLGFEEPFTVATWVRPVRVPRFGTPLPQGWGAGSTTRACGDHIPEDAAQLAQGWANAMPVAAARSPDYLRWRYEAHPDTYRVVRMYTGSLCHGLALWKETVQRGLRIAQVVELLAGDAEGESALLAHVVRDVRDASRAELVAVWKPAHLGIGSLVARGFLPRRAQTHFLLRSDASIPTQLVTRLRDRRKWHLSMGDFFDV
jgi:GNAT superfamily N-acetyltransferase